ncbi:hypothetical protein B296_00031163 [Ensete ventricosum]|uniref:Uncharacterized protein n=1 Tax=Ensete ventricosum TaxID=4639 RepID=A0A427AGZ1_ENSVE|nr:hypothetical protein B296_00031163 [Ensete ventricosum]
MLRPGVTREWVGKGELPKEQTQSEVAEAIHGEIIKASVISIWELCTIEGEFRVQVPASPMGDLIIQRYNRSDWTVGLLQYSHSLRESGKSEDKAEGESIDREKRDADARQWKVGPWAWQRMVPQRRDFRGVIDPLLSWRESVGRGRSREGGECKGKLQVPRQGRRAKAKELHKTGVNGLLIKIAENGGLRVDAGVLNQGTNKQHVVLYLFYSEE